MIYSIVYNSTQFIDTNRMHNIVTTAIMATDWWHYLPNMYLVNTTLNSAQVTSTLQTQFPGMLFIVTKIDTSDYNGVLPKDAWDWMQKYNETNNLIKIRKVSDTSYSAPIIELAQSMINDTKTKIDADILQKAYETLLKEKKK